MHLQTLPNEYMHVLTVSMDTKKLWSHLEYTDLADSHGSYGLIDTYKRVNRSKPGAKHITKEQLFSILPRATLAAQTGDTIGEKVGKNGFARIKHVITCDGERYILSGRYFPRSHTDEVPADWLG